MNNGDDTVMGERYIGGPPPDHAALHKDLAEVMGEVGYVQKDGVNIFHRYKYATAESLLKKVNPALSARGICVSTTSELLRYERVGAEGKEKVSAVIHMTVYLGRGNASVKLEGLGEGSDSGDKAVMKANTAALKYALSGGFLISWGDDPEADASTDADVADVAEEEPAPAPKKGRKAKAKAAPTHLDLPKEPPPPWWEGTVSLAHLAEADTAAKMAAVKQAIVAVHEADPQLYVILRDAYKAKEKGMVSDGES